MGQFGEGQPLAAFAAAVKYQTPYHWAAAYALTALGLLGLVLGTGACVASEDEATLEQTLTAAQRKARMELIRDSAAEMGVHNAALLAGIAVSETNFAHCWSEATWACQGPASPSCDGGPVIAGAADGPCAQQQGGLGIIPTLFGLQNGNGERARAAVRALGAASSATQPLVCVQVCVRCVPRPGAPPRRRQRRLHGAAHAGAAAPGLPLAPAEIGRRPSPAQRRVVGAIGGGRGARSGAAPLTQHRH